MDSSLYANNFVRAAMTPESMPPSLFGGDEPRVAAGWHVYQNNIFHSLTEALRASFPVVNTLVGDAFFGACARLYISQEPPSGPVLAEYGDTFPDFLAGFEPAKSLAYLGDVARLEWTMLTACHGPDASPLEIEEAELSDVGRIGLHPTLQLVSSRFPIVNIWQAHQTDEVEEVDLGAGAQIALIIRPFDDVLVLAILPSEREFLAALSEGSPVGDAFEAAEAVPGDFDLASSLSRFFELGVFVASPDL